MFGHCHCHSHRQPTPHEMQYIAQALGMDYSTVQSIYTQFMQASRDGVMQRREFIKWYIQTFAPYSHNPLTKRKTKRMANMLFHSMDKDRSGSLSFQEFITGVVMLRGQGCARDKLRFAMEASSEDGSLPEYMELNQVNAMVGGLDKLYRTNYGGTVYSQVQSACAGQQTIETSQLLDILDGSSYGTLLNSAYNIDSSSDLSD